MAKRTLTMHELETRRTPAAVTHLVHDVNLLPASSNPSPAIAFEDDFLVLARDNSFRTGLWRSDGTSAGTTLVYDNVQSPGSDGLVRMQDTVYFRACDSDRGFGFWRSNGTSSGTVLVRAIGSSTIRNLTAVGSQLFFTANDSASAGEELWVSDGTSAGTRLVADLQPGSKSSSPQFLTNFNGKLAFVANTSEKGSELWTSDGTSQGTTLLADLLPGSGGSSPNELLAIGNTLYFGADDGIHGRELWKSDGIESELVADLLTIGTATEGPHSFVELNGKLMFAAVGDGVGVELWISDGTSSGTVLVNDITSGGFSSSPLFLTEVDNDVYFITNPHMIQQAIWRSDGTSSGTVQVADTTAFGYGATISNLANGNGQLFFDRRVNGVTTLWHSNGTSAGTTPFISVNGSAGTIRTIGSKTFFSANDGLHGMELWQTDGTPGGTSLVRDLAPGTIGSSITESANAGGTIIFRANDAVNGDELWASDGTSSGTRLLRDLFPGTTSSGIPKSSAPEQLTTVNGIVYFRANDGIHGRELWRTDGTSNGTFMVHDIQPGSASSEPTSLFNWNGTLYFSAFGNDGTLWRSDGTSAGTLALDGTSPFYSAGEFAVFQNRLFFTANGGLGVTDGTPGGTQYISVAATIPRNLASTPDRLFFTSNGGGFGLELWQSDGTSAGTGLVRDIRVGSADSSPIDFTGVGQSVYFIADDGIHGEELWRSDGTSAGTFIVSDIRPGAADSRATALTNFNGVLFFQADDGVHGAELWRSDGTSTGTILVRDLQPGNASSSPRNFFRFNDRLYFNASTTADGSEFWTSDGTSTGTFAVTDSDTSLGAADKPLTINERVFFTGRDPTTQNELFIFVPVPLIHRIDTTASNGTYSTGQTIPITLTWNTPVTLTGGNLLLKFNSGTTAIATVTPFTGSSMTATYTVGVGESSPDLSVISIELSAGATLRDANGNNAALRLPALNLDVTSAIIVNPMAPNTTFTVNATATQRSRLTSIDLTFSAPVNAANLAVPGAITLTRTTPNDGAQVDMNSGLILSTTTGMVTNITLTFANVSTSGINNASLADGRWRISIPNLNYQSPLNDPTLRRLFGDANNDGTVNAIDFAEFGNAFGQTLSNSPFDFNNDGTIQADDFAEFGNRFGVTL